MGSESRASFARSPKRVLMVTSALAMGGCERQILATAEGLVALGYEIEIFELAEIHSQFGLDDEFWKLGITSRRPSDFYDELLSHAEHRPESELSRFASLVEHLDIAQLGLALDQAIREFKPTIVHCWSDPANVIGGFVAAAIGVPRILLSQRNVPPFRMGIAAADLYRDAYRRLMRNPQLVIVNNSATNRAEHEAWLDLPSGTTHLIYNGFSPRSVHLRSKRDAAMCRRSLGLQDGAPVVGAIMRFAAEKDPFLWLETAAAVAASRPDAQFVLAGYGELADDIARKVQDLGMTDRVILPGPIVDVGSIYALMDVFLMTSRFEGVPNVLIEAQAAGVPVVTPAVGGTAEALCNGTTGLLIADRQASSLAGAVLKILTEPQWRRNVAAYGPAFVSERFGQSRMIHETITLYDQPATTTVELPHKPEELTMQRIRRASLDRINSLRAAIDRERRAHAGHLADLQRSFEGERQAAIARIRELETTLHAERQAAIARIRGLETTLHAERDAFIARISELESAVEAERRAHADQFAGQQTTFGAEREAAVLRIRELEATLGAERRAFTDHIRDLEATLRAERRAFTDHIRQLDAAIEHLRGARWFGLGAVVATARKWVLARSAR